MLYLLEVEKAVEVPLRVFSIKRYTAESFSVRFGVLFTRYF